MTGPKRYRSKLPKAGPKVSVMSVMSVTVREIPILPSYILSLPTSEEQDAYLRDMLDPSNRDHADLVIEFTEKREEFGRGAIQLLN